LKFKALSPTFFAFGKKRTPHFEIDDVIVVAMEIVWWCGVFVFGRSFDVCLFASVDV